MHNSKADVVSDLNKYIKLENEIADTIISLSVMEHLCEPQMFLNESYRILKKDGIIFWDEAFSNLDEHSKNRIYENVLRSTRYSDKTMLMVSHHLDIVNFVDYIIFIDSETGEVIKDSHENLMKRNSNYENFIRSKV